MSELQAERKLSGDVDTESGGEVDRSSIRERCVRRERMNKMVERDRVD